MLLLALPGLTRLAAPQQVDEPIISPRLDYEPTTTGCAHAHSDGVPDNNPPGESQENSFGSRLALVTLNTTACPTWFSAGS